MRIDCRGAYCKKNEIGYKSPLIERISEYFEIDAKLIKSTAKQRQASRARSLLCYLAVSRLKISSAEIARKLKVAPSTVSKCIYRGQSDELSKKVEKNLFDG